MHAFTYFMVYIFQKFDDDGPLATSIPDNGGLDLTSSRDLLNSSGVLNLSSSCSDISQLEINLEEAEEKIAGLLKVKEKLVLVQVGS